MTPAAFARALYCVGTNAKPLKGVGATALGCPSSGNRRQFVSRNPGLFRTSGYALHPYGFDVAPNRPYPNRSWITFENLGSFRRLLQRALAAYGQHPRGGPQIYLTEWGYKTRPPNPFNKTTLGEQQEWLDEGDYLAWKDSYVRALAQFLLVDDTPKPGARRGSRAYWSTFQTGLEYSSGQPKPAFYTFRIPDLAVARLSPQREPLGAAPRRRSRGGAAGDGVVSAQRLVNVDRRSTGPDDQPRGFPHDPPLASGRRAACVSGGSIPPPAGPTTAVAFASPEGARLPTRASTEAPWRAAPRRCRRRRRSGCAPRGGRPAASSCRSYATP